MGKTDPSPQERLAKIKQLGNTPDAIALLKDLLAESPDFIPARIELGLIYRRTGERNLALDTFLATVELNPRHAWANIHAAVELQHFERYESAERYLKQTLERYPNQVNVSMHLGYLKRKQANSEQALQWFSLASQQATNSNQVINAQLCVVEELRGLGKTERAIATIQPILAEFPRHIYAKLVYGTLLKQQLKFIDAVEVYQNIISLEAKNIQAHLELSTCLNRLDRSSAALKILEQAFAFAPSETRVFKRIGNLYRQQGNRTQALEYYQKSLAIAPRDLIANLDVAIELQELNQFEAASQRIDRALEYHPHNFPALMQRGKLEQKRQQLAKALEYFQQAALHHPEKVQPHLAIVDILYSLGRLSEAQNSLTMLLKQHPEDYQVLIHAGDFARKQGQRTKALEWFRLADQTAKSSADSLRAELGEIEELKELGRLNEALELVEAIIQQFPDNTRPQMIKGSILQKMPNLSEAAKVYQEMLAREPDCLPSLIELAKIKSQSGQVEAAIVLLEEAYQSCGANLQLFIQLGSLNQAMDNWSAALKWYREICQQYPYHHQGYSMLANLLFLQGEKQASLKLLQEARTKLPNVIAISLKLIELHLRLGNLDSAQQLLTQELSSFPSNVQLLWQLCRLNMDRGDHIQALEVLKQISTDNQDWIGHTEELRANIYFYQYNYEQAEIHLRKAIALSPIAISARNRLATILMITGRIDEARQELKTATEELNRKSPPGKVTVPLKSHPAMVINELRIEPAIFEKLKAIHQQQGYDKILEFGSLLIHEPTYLGTALYLAIELRQQGIFEKIRQVLSISTTDYPTIPRRIVQYWDDPLLPEEVRVISQSWRELNPNYEYLLFSKDRAIAFLEQHYDRRVIQAFHNCDQAATEADFFRLAYLNKMGGFYADADDMCLQSLDVLLQLRPELVVLQEDFSCIGNNFIGCIPAQNAIRTAFYQAVTNLASYCNEGPWFKTGPGLITSVVSSSLIPYLTYTDYQMWPRLLVLCQAQSRKIINPHLFLAYKRSNKSWQQEAYSRRIKLASF